MKYKFYNNNVISSSIIIIIIIIMYNFVQVNINSFFLMEAFLVLQVLLALFNLWDHIQMYFTHLNTKVGILALRKYGQS